MALKDFFRINLPYGLAKNENNEWIAFNREYMPLGFSGIENKDDRGFPNGSYSQFPVFAKYKGLTDKKLHEIAGSEDFIKRDERNEIQTIWLYQDGTNPRDNKKARDSYFDKIWRLSKFEVA